MHLVDSSVIVAFFRTSEENHNEAAKLLSSLEAFSVNDYILSEVATVLRIKESLPILRKAVDLLRSTEGISLLRLTDKELHQAIDFFLSSKKKLSFVDASLVVLAKSRGLKLLTFDKDLIQSL